MESLKKNKGIISPETFVNLICDRWSENMGPLSSPGQNRLNGISCFDRETTEQNAYCPAQKFQKLTQL